LDLPQAHPDNTAGQLAIVGLFHECCPRGNENNRVFLKVNGWKGVVKKSPPLHKTGSWLTPTFEYGEE
jgi:hypothetical protein